MLTKPIPLNNEQYPIYDVAYFHPDSQSINALSRDNKLPIEGYYPNRVLPNLMTHCNNSTTAPSFDCIKYTPNNPTIMIRPPHMVKKGTGGKRYDLVFYNHYEPTPLTNEQFPIYNVAKQRQNSL